MTVRLLRAAVPGLLVLALCGCKQSKQTPPSPGAAGPDELSPQTIQGAWRVESVWRTGQEDKRQSVPTGHLMVFEFRADGRFVMIDKLFKSVVGKWEIVPGEPRVDIVLQKSGKGEERGKAYVDVKDDAIVYHYKKRKHMLARRYKGALNQPELSRSYNDVGRFVGGMAIVNVGAVIGGEYGMINREGKEVVPAIYKSINHFKDGRALVSVKGGKMGYVDTKGRMVIAPIYRSAKDFSGGKAKVTEGDETFYIDPDGKRIE